MTPPSIPDHPFTAREAAALGFSRHQLRQHVAAGRVAHVVHGVYVPSWWPRTPEGCARAAAHVLPDHCVVVDRSASSLWGIDVLDFAELDLPPRLEVASVHGHAPTRRQGVLGGKRALLPEEITTVNGVPLTIPVRTAADIACLRGRHRAIGTLDAYRSEYGLTEADFLRVLPRFAGRRGVTQLRELIPLSRSGVDSQPESWVRIDIRDEGYPMPEAQAWVWVPGWGKAKVENAFEHLRVAVEYDGEENHSEEGDVEHDAARRAALRENAGWIIIVVRRDGFSGPGRQKWLAELAAAFAQRAPDPPAKRLYARSPEQRSRRRRPWT